VIEGRSFREEFIHFFQHHYYPGGLSQYSNKGRINIEFEAKLIQDILCFHFSLDLCSKLGAQGDKAGEYARWVEDLNPALPSYEGIKEKYWMYMENFRKAMPVYDYPIDKDLKPEVLNFLNRHACK